MTAAPPLPTAARAPASSHEPSAAGRSPAPSVLLPLLSLAATADMVVPGGTRLPAPLWALLLFGVAVAAAARGRRGRRAHLAVEPAGMALMMVLHALHGAAPAVAPAAAAGHAHAGTGWIAPLIAVAVAVLAAACLVCAAAEARAAGLRRALLPLVSALAMAAMTVWMLLPAVAPTAG